jgi:N-acetyl-anhydromuramyl-L-alanine amidase AmpD
MFFQTCLKKLLRRLPESESRGIAEDPVPVITPAPYNITPKNPKPISHTYPKNWKYIQDPDGGNSPLNTTSPTGVLLHHTVTYNLNATVSYFKRNVVDVHFVIGHDGKIVQMADCNTRCAHAGKSQWKEYVHLNNFFVGIELVNLGPLTYKDGVYKDTYGRVFEGEVRKRDVMGHKYWEACPAAQEKALIELCVWLRDRYRIPVGNFIAHFEASPGRKIDPAGALSFEDMGKFRARLLLSL